MKVLIVYGTTEGQTRKIVRFCADRLAAAGHGVELLPAAEAEDVEVSGFDAAILAASVHGGRYQGPLRRFARDHAAALHERPTLFLSVSLSAAGDDPEDWEGLGGVLERFLEATGWTPDRVEHVAGAFRFTEYDYFKSWIMRRIARDRGEEIDPEQDKEYTDWAALGTAIDGWAAAAAG